MARLSAGDESLSGGSPGLLVRGSGAFRPRGNVKPPIIGLQPCSLKGRLRRKYFARAEHRLSVAPGLARFVGRALCVPVSFTGNSTRLLRGAPGIPQKPRPFEKRNPKGCATQTPGPPAQVGARYIVPGGTPERVSVSESLDSCPINDTTEIFSACLKLDRQIASNPV